MTDYFWIDWLNWLAIIHWHQRFPVRYSRAVYFPLTPTVFSMLFSMTIVWMHLSTVFSTTPTFPVRYSLWQTTLSDEWWLEVGARWIVRWRVVGFWCQMNCQMNSQMNGGWLLVSDELSDELSDEWWLKVGVRWIVRWIVRWMVVETWKLESVNCQMKNSLSSDGFFREPPSISKLKTSVKSSNHGDSNTL